MNGVRRTIDGLGRIVLPKELRDHLRITQGTPMEIFTDDDGSIVLMKYARKCVFCGGRDRLITYNDTCACRLCIKKLGIIASI